MDYLEEQKNEIEALESIYYGDLDMISMAPYKFSIPIKTEEYDSGQAGLSCTLTFTLTPKYPEEAPDIEIEESDEFESSCATQLLEYLKEQVQENLGMVMIFTVVSAAQEWLNIRFETAKWEQEKSEAKQLQEEEEAERKRFEGTRVTVETFMKWKISFEDEMGITSKRELAEKEGKKLTGRELFVRDVTLNESDLKFLEDGDKVKVDESLFQDMDDLDIEDDEDYVPESFSDSSN